MKDVRSVSGSELKFYSMHDGFYGNRFKKSEMVDYSEVLHVWKESPVSVLDTFRTEELLLFLRHLCGFSVTQ